MNDSHDAPPAAPGGTVLLIRCGHRMCAFPTEHVDEIMRPLPVQPLPDTPDFVVGSSLLRGSVAPIVDLAAVLTEGAPEAARLIALRVTEQRRVGVLVSDVIGVRDALEVAAEELPPLLGAAAEGTVRALGRLDEQLLTVLDLTRLVPAAVWAALQASADPAEAAA